MASAFRRVIRIIFFALGWFEMMMVYKLLTLEAGPLNQEQLYYPADFFRFPTRYFLIIFTFLLGMIRLVWSVGDNSFPAWLFIVSAHLGELTFLWRMASLPHFNRGNAPLPKLIEKVISLQVGNANSRLILLIVPVLVLLLIVHGPGDSRPSSSKQKSN